MMTPDQVIRNASKLRLVLGEMSYTARDSVKDASALGKLCQRIGENLTRLAGLDRIRHVTNDVDFVALGRNINQQEMLYLKPKLEMYLSASGLPPEEAFRPVIRRALSELTERTEKEMLMEVVRGTGNGRKAPGFRILHFSDLHLGQFHLSPEDFEDSSGFSSILDSLTEAIMDDDEKPDFILFTGDITSMAEEECFNEFKNHLVELTQLLGIPRSHLIILHGNHDIFWPTMAEGRADRFKHCFSGDEWNTVFSPERASFSDTNGFCWPFGYIGSKGTVFCYPEYRFAVVALDSCYHSGRLNKKVMRVWEKIRNIGGLSDAERQELKALLGKLVHVDKGKLRTPYVREGMKKLKSALEEAGGERNEWYVCALLHHNLTEIDGVTVTVLKSYIRVRKILLEAGIGGSGAELLVDNVLHGHVHVDNIAQSAPEIISAATIGGLYRPGNHGFNIIDVGDAYEGEFRERVLRRYWFNPKTFGFEESGPPYPMTPRV